MKLLPIASLAVVLSAAAWPSADAAAAESTLRVWTQGAAGACAAFAPTQQIRTSASGVKNAGTATFYVACGMAGDFKGKLDGGASETEIVVANRGEVAVKVSCTLRPGYVDGDTPVQGAFPQSRTLEPGEQYWFEFNAEDLALLGDDEFIANPNFTCTLPPNVEITHMNRYYREDIGT